MGGGIAKPSLLNWVGGKVYHVKRILPYIVEHRTYAEPFCGGCSILFNKTESYQEVINDLDGNIVNLWRVIRDHHDELLESFRYAPCSRELFNDYVQRLRDETYADDIERAHMFLYVNRAAYGGKMNAPCFGVSAGSHYRQRLRPGDLDVRIIAYWKRMINVVIEHLPYQELIRRYDKTDTFFYLDPPYRNTTRYAIGKFTDDDYRELFDICGKIKGKFLLTINNDDFIRDLFSPFHFIEQDVSYSLNCANGLSTQRKELVITNY